MKIGVIGAGFVGRAVSKVATKAGHEVMLSNSRGPQTLFSVRALIGARVGTVEEAATFGDTVVIAIPLGAFRSVPAAPLVGKVVIDAGNYVPERDGRIAELDRRMATSSELLAAHLPGARLVKAFNAIRMDDLESWGRPAGSPDRLALPFAGGDAEAKAIVAGLYEAAGFDAVDAGALSDGWRFERGTPAYCAPLGKADLDRTLAATMR